MSATFASLATPVYRRYLGGQAVSLTGTWMQSVGQAWLVLQLTHSGTMLGLVTAARFVPVLLLAPLGGVLADRVDKRVLLLATQTLLGLLSLLLGVLTVTHVVALWMVIVVAVGFGIINAADNPARQTFVMEMVGRDLLRNAVTLNSVMVNVARAVGPAVAGLLISGVGVGICFLVNAATYVAVLVVLARMDVTALQPAEPAGREPGQLRAGLRYVRRTPALLIPLLMMALVGTLTYEFQVVLPVFATDTLHGGAATYGWLSSAMGGGAIAGGLVVAARSATGGRPLVVAAALFGVAVLATAAAPTEAVALVLLVAVGAASVTFLAVGNSTLQLAAEPAYRGRVMALWSMAFLGSTPVGGPVIGLISEQWSPRYGLGVGGLACLVAAALGLLLLGVQRRAGRRPGAGSRSPVGVAG